MRKININLEYCYGIKKFIQEFDFSSHNVHLIYAPNGTMKTSFAKTFKDICESRHPQDIIFPERQTKYKIVDENQDEILKEQIFVIEPYDSNFISNGIGTLLVNKKLKDQFDNIHLEINSKKEQLINNLNKISQIQNDIIGEFTKSFQMNRNAFFECLENIEDIVLNNDDNSFKSIVYNDIFNDKVINFLQTKDFKTRISEYILKYNDLLKDSKYFKKGIFNHNNALNICKNLHENGFFNAQHSIILNSIDERSEILSQEELEYKINEEKRQILNNPQLKTQFEIIDKAITKNIDLRKFRDYLENNVDILLELEDIDKFSQKIWISYFKQEKILFAELLNIYKKGKNEIQDITKQAKKEKTEWENVVEIFNKRFNVPFELKIENQEDVILNDKTPNVVFYYKDGSEIKEVQKYDLLKTLSNGEKRALYILNIIFEIEYRKKENIKSLLIIDDIADSFDYKNKYAIIEYLYDVAKNGNFNQLVLTHNFDFFRTIQSRLKIHREVCYMINKSISQINLVKAEYFNPFNHFKKNLNNNKILIAFIPFVRNLIEYTLNTQDLNYLKLTSLLHLKSDTRDITFLDLKNIIKEIFPNLNLNIIDENRKVIDLIFELAEECCTITDECVNLENKIILSIATRLQSELFMINQIKDEELVNNIKKDQTQNLLIIYKNKFENKIDEIKLLEQVNLMTPENIHLNSFMYEPILDLSDEHLKYIYQEIKKLNKKKDAPIIS